MSENEKKFVLQKDCLPLHGPSIDSSLIAVNPSEIEDVTGSVLEGGFTEVSGKFPDGIRRTFYIVTSGNGNEAANNNTGGGD